MADPAYRRADLEGWMAEAVDAHGLTGLTLGVLDGDETVELATGWANRDARIEAAPDAVHQIGSITKIYTTTMIQRLAAQGQLDLDDPVTGHLPELRIGGNDRDLSGIRIRHLLTHTSGIGGDAFFDTGQADEALERWVSALAATALEADPGQRWSYCNAGFVLAGRIIEKRTGLPFRRALRELVTRPLGIRTPVVSPFDAIRFRAAVGHVPTHDGSTRTSAWARLSYSNAAAGSTPSATVGDVLAFVRAHFDDEDERLAPRRHLDAMRDEHADIPAYLAAGMGLGWWRVVTDPLVVEHGGSTQTQNALLEVCPSRRFATIAFGNDLQATPALRNLTRRIWAELAGIELPPEPTAVEPAPVVDVAPLTGTYRRLANTVAVTTGGDGSLDVTTTFELPGQEARRTELHDPRASTADGRTWVATDQITGGPVVLDFREWEDGRPTVLHTGARANLRTG